MQYRFACISQGGKIKKICRRDRIHLIDDTSKPTTKISSLPTSKQ